MATKEVICDRAHRNLCQYLRLADMPKEEEVQRLAELYRVFADGTRVRILTLLLSGELCVCEIADALGATQSAVSHQLRLLRDSRLVKSRREGKSIFYSLDDMHVETIIAQGLEHLRHSDK